MAKDRSTRKKKEKRSKSRDKKRSKRSPSDTETDSDGSDDAGDEKMTEYLAKKAQKMAAKVAKRLKTGTVSGYTDASNPFGDSNLTEKFVWRKKIEKDVVTGVLDPRQITVKAEKKRTKAQEEEIEKVKKRRQDREREKAQHEEEMTLLARERSRAEFHDWEKKEEEFNYEQSKLRSEIRVKEGRAKPIDILAQNLNLTEDFDVEVNEPYKIFKGLTVPEMEDLRGDIKMRVEQDRATPTHSRFWPALMVVCDQEITEGTKRDILDRARVRGEHPPPELLADEQGLHKAVDEEVAAMLAGRSSAELAEMQQQIESKMVSGTAKVIEYWEAVMKRLKIAKAKALLKEIHYDLLRRHLAHLEGKELPEDHNPPPPPDGEGEAQVDAEEVKEVKEVEEGEEGEGGDFSPELMTEEEAAKEGGVVEEEEEGAEAEAGSFSPELLQGGGGEEVVDPEADRRELEEKRALVVAEQQRRLRAAAAAETQGGDPLTAAEKAAANKAMGHDEGDVVLGQGAEVSLESQVYWWHDKYRPRKPKYFNRVHTGYEWNKYNQTHYDHDNPPPKIVQGYKFNIFFPDLIDKVTAPTYAIDKDGSDGETCLIRFHAGPPYEDIAFRVVNKEWEYSHKKGFKCTFERGILHVYFNFKRYRYRR